MSPWQQFCELNKVGLRYRDVLLTKCDKLPKDFIQKGLEWCKNPYSIMLTGEPGRGKTHYAYCLARALVSHHGLGKIRWTKSKAMDDEILKSFNLYGDVSHTLNKFSEIPILFIDDFGVDRGTERTERDYYEIIDKRWENMSVTVISTNLDEQNIEKNYGSRIFSRLKEFAWIRFNGPDLRERK